MRKWQNNAPPDDLNSWNDVDGFWPTLLGDYETISPVDTGTAATATGTGDPIYAWCANTITSRREFVLTSAFIWEYAAGTYTDRTGGVTIGTKPFMAQYGDVTICAMGNGTATVKSTGGNFSALAGAPKAEIVLVVANAVLALNTDTSADGWAASDVGDYTNWTTGEAATGRLIQTPGPITAGVSFGNYAIVFKGDAIYRMTYVGGVVKWASELLFRGIGCTASTSYVLAPKYACCVGGGNILFPGYYGAAGTGTGSYYYIFDGVSPPRRVNPLTTVVDGRMTYNPQRDLFTIKHDDLVSGGPTYSSTMYYYCPKVDMWGKYANVTASFLRVPLMGDFSATSELSSTPTMYGKSAANTLTRYASDALFDSAHLASCYLQTMKIGDPIQISGFTRLIPQYRTRSENFTSSSASSFTFYNEVNSVATATQTKTPSESSGPHWFDFTATDNYGMFKVSWTNIFVQIGDMLAIRAPSGNKR